VPKGPPNQFLHGKAQTLQQMVQSLLADRFKLALHRETKEMPVYALIFAVLLSRRLSLRLSSCPIGPILSHGHGNPCCARPDMGKET